MGKKLQDYFILLFVFTSLFSLTQVTAATRVNKQINFQGKLTNADGANAADNSYSVVFTLYKVFVIVLNKPGSEDTRFSWTALAIEEPAMFDDSIKSSIMISPSVLGSESAERDN